MSSRMPSLPPTPEALTTRTALHAAPEDGRPLRDVLACHPRPEQAIAELHLFCLWLAQRAGLADDLPLRSRPQPTAADATWIEAAFDGAWIDDLVDSRCELYDRFFLVGRHPGDPLGLDAAALALACQLSARPEPELLACLRRRTRQRFEAARLARRLPPP